MTRRYESKCRQNQDRFVILGQVRQMPDDGAGGDRRRGGVSRTQALTWNCRNQALDAKGEAQAAAGVVGLTKVLAIEWAASAVRVNAIGPGYVRTALTEQAEAEGKLDFNALVRRVPVGRLATPAEIADIALFLASDAAAYITGQTLV